MHALTAIEAFVLPVARLLARHPGVRRMVTARQRILLLIAIVVVGLVTIALVAVALVIAIMMPVVVAVMLLVMSAVARPLPLLLRHADALLQWRRHAFIQSGRVGFEVGGALRALQIRVIVVIEALLGIDVVAGFFAVAALTA